MPGRSVPRHRATPDGSADATRRSSSAAGPSSAAPSLALMRQSSSRLGYSPRLAYRVALASMPVEGSNSDTAVRCGLPVSVPLRVSALPSHAAKQI
jgi:hypothetical protein